MGATNLFELKNNLQGIDFEHCLAIIKNYELVDSGKSLDEYLDYLIPNISLIREQANDDTLNYTLGAQKIIDDNQAINIEVKEK